MGAERTLDVLFAVTLGIAVLVLLPAVLIAGLLLYPWMD